MEYLLSVNPKVRIYAPKENFGVYGFSLPSSFYRKDESLPPEQCIRPGGQWFRRKPRPAEIGRASCRERVCHNV